jgi:hypothetical protein
VAPAELLELGIRPALGGSEHVDQVAWRSAVGEGTDLGPDHVLLGEDRSVRALGDGSPEDLFEDVDFAFLPGGGVRHGETSGQRRGLQRLHLLAPGCQAATECGCDVGHGRRVLGGDIEVLAGTVHEAVRPHCIPAGEDQRVRRAEGDHIR